MEHTVPPPADNSVQVQFLASPINPADINQVEGVYPLKPAMTTQLYSPSSSDNLPVAVGGNEGVARIIQVGTKVQDLKVGDWVVMGSAGLGTWRSHGNFKATDLTRITEKAGRGGKDGAPRLDRLQLATLTVNPCTAYRMLRDFKTLSAGNKKKLSLRPVVQMRIKLGSLHRSSNLSAADDLIAWILQKKMTYF